MPYNRPYGDDFILQTPHLDELERRVYRQQQLNDLRRYQENKSLDDEFARNLSGIRDADIGNLTKAYGDFKLGYQGLMKQRNGVSPEQQLEVLRKKSAIYDIINKSKQRKEWEKLQGVQIMKDIKGIYADDAHQQLIEMINTPLSDLDTNKDANLLYQYSMPDLNKELKFAQGEPREVTVTVGQSETDPFKDDKEVYKVGNSPLQYYNSLLQGVVASNKIRNFTGVISHKYNDQELEDLQNKYYAKINDPKFIALYGKPEPFPESSTKTDLGKAVAIETMENVLNTPLTPTKKISEVNQARKLDRQFVDFQKKEAIRQKNRIILAGITDAYIKGRQEYGHALSQADKATADLWIDDYVDKITADAKSGTQILFSGGSGPEYSIKVDPVLNESLKVDGQTPDTVTVTPEGDYRLIFYKYDKDNNRTNEVDQNRTRVINKEAMKLALGKKSAGVKQTNVEMSSSKPDGSYMIKGKKYSEAELLKMGYSKDQIAPYKQK